MDWVSEGVEQEEVMAAATYEIEVDDQISGFFARWSEDPRFCAAVMALPPDVDPFECTKVDGRLVLTPSREVLAVAESLGG